jgi:hypothetical protein
VLRKWNGKRINVDELVHEFRIWLTQQEINLNREKRKNRQLENKTTPQTERAKVGLSQKLTRSRDFYKHRLETIEKNVYEG